MNLMGASKIPTGPEILDHLAFLNTGSLSLQFFLLLSLIRKCKFYSVTWQ